MAKDRVSWVRRARRYFVLTIVVSLLLRLMGNKDAGIMGTRGDNGRIDCVWFSKLDSLNELRAFLRLLDDRLSLLFRT